MEMRPLIARSDSAQHVLSVFRDVTECSMP